MVGGGAGSVGAGGPTAAALASAAIPRQISVNSTASLASALSGGSGGGGSGGGGGGAGIGGVGDAGRGGEGGYGGRDTGRMAAVSRIAGVQPAWSDWIKQVIYCVSNAVLQCVLLGISGVFVEVVRWWTVDGTVCQVRVSRNV